VLRLHDTVAVVSVVFEEFCYSYAFTFFEICRAEWRSSFRERNDACKPSKFHLVFTSATGCPSHTWIKQNTWW